MLRDSFTDYTDDDLHLHWAVTDDLVLMTWLVLPASNVSDHSLLQCLQCLQTWDWVSQLSEERLVKLIWLAGRGGRVSSSSSLSTQPTSRYDNQRSQITLCSLHSDLTINCLHCSELFINIKAGSESVKTIRHYFPRIDKNTLSRGWADDDLNSQISKYFSLHGWEYWRYWESLQQVIHCSPHSAYYCHESVEWCSTLAIFHWCHTSQSSDLTWSTHHADPSIIAPI